jgi:hypothetical protein
VLSGTASLEQLAEGAATMPSMDAGPVAFEDVEVLQASFEMPYATRQTTLPPGLHPTTPPLLVVLAWSVAGGTWGSWTMAQIRVSCRSGVRPRGFVHRCVVDSEDAAGALRAGWGVPALTGPVVLERFYDSVVLTCAALALTGIDPDPLGAGDVQYTVSTTLANTPMGLRLVQVEPEYEMARVERIRPRIDRWDTAMLGGVLETRAPVTATIGVGRVVLPAVRFVSRPDVLAFEGTEKL